ncbi:putative MFS family arabinose efflux permease [Paenibacillus taihuensis]|uniref:Putative MFS family arabinose efflux permease n=1 Tax=Paenibacillus taihuensis TaxID=1156355 RepID=A0A3D9SE61_9BACL|nr:MFS transporter [Paenibacillus taihuensis]REE93168.1 putative MFS family arabinose efflux permease [Paenibacillus taihuensis]
MLKNNRSFAKMFIAYGLSALGDYFDFMAVAILLGLIWKADAMTVALMPLSFAVPSILFSQLAGILADRWNKRNLMIATDLIRACITVMLIFAPNAAVLIGLIALRSTARVFHYPAQQAMTRGVVEPDQLLQATSLNGAVFQLSKVLGPLLGVTVATVFSPSSCMAVNAASFVLSACLLLLIPSKHGRIAAAEAISKEPFQLRTAWRHGWRILLQSSTLRVSLIFCLIGLSGIQMIDAQISVLLRDVAPHRPELIGWLVTAIGAGGLASVTWLRRFKQLSAYGWLLGGGVTLIGIMFAVAGMFRQDTPLCFILFTSFIGGIGTGFTSAGMNYILQKETPSEAIGRVSGIYDSLSSVIFVIAPLIGGALIEQWGASFTFLFVGIIVGSVGMIGVVLQRLLWRTTTSDESTSSYVA